jgi:hypothetical protein
MAVGGLPARQPPTREPITFDPLYETELARSPPWEAGLFFACYPGCRLRAKHASVTGAPAGFTDSLF